jgi:hypothetical protein
MKTHVLALWVLFVVPGLAQDPPKKGQTYQVTRVDLNRDGSPEKVGLSCVEVKESGWYSRLTVWNGQGQKVWQSMPAKVGVWAFGGWDWGISDLQWVGDIDGDGAVEAVSPDPVSDVSPVRFRVYRWSGKAFHHVRTAALLPTPDGEYRWSDRTDGTSWIGSFKKGGVGVVWTTSSSGEPRLRDARLQGRSTGFRVLKWLSP